MILCKKKISNFDLKSIQNNISQYQNKLTDYCNKKIFMCDYGYIKVTEISDITEYYKALQNNRSGLSISFMLDDIIGFIDTHIGIDNFAKILNKMDVKTHIICIDDIYVYHEYRNSHVGKELINFVRDHYYSNSLILTKVYVNGAEDGWTDKKYFKKLNTITKYFEKRLFKDINNLTGYETHVPMIDIYNPTGLYLYQLIDDFYSNCIHTYHSDDQTKSLILGYAYSIFPHLSFKTLGECFNISPKIVSKIVKEDFLQNIRPDIREQYSVMVNEKIENTKRMFLPKSEKEGE